MTSEKSVERSIDSLQRIYAVIIALAIGDAIRKIFLRPGGGEIEFHFGHLPEFIAFIFTAVPFLHGMNRHMDKTLAESRRRNNRGLLVYLLIDFAVFLAESCFLFILAEKVMSGAEFYDYLIALLTIDLVWAVVTIQITKSILLWWMLVNVGAAALLCTVSFCFSGSDLLRAWIMAGVAVGRTLLDYCLAWSFYFPEEASAAGPATASPAPAALVPAPSAPFQPGDTKGRPA